MSWPPRSTAARPPDASLQGRVVVPNGSNGPPHIQAAARMQALRARIVDLILERGLGPGDAIPTESELMATLGVGRNTLREALKALQAIGVVDVRHGYGMQVGAGGLDSLVESLTFRGRLSLRQDLRAARELVQVREALEVGLVPMTITLSLPRDLARVQHAVEGMEARARHGEAFPDLDHEFHRLLFAPLENSLLSELLAAFWLVYQQIRADLGEGPHADHLRTAADHRAIHDAVASGDAALAADAIRRHFVGIHERLAHAALAAGTHHFDHSPVVGTSATQRQDGPSDPA